MDCDISMENSLALHNTKMLSVYAGVDERVRVLGYAVKHFSKVGIRSLLKSSNIFYIYYSCDFCFA